MWILRRNKSGPAGLILPDQGCTGCAHRLSTSDHMQPTWASAVKLFAVSFTLPVGPCRPRLPPAGERPLRRICLRLDEHMQITSL